MSDCQDRMSAFININFDLDRDHGKKSSMELGGSTPTLPSRVRAEFFGQRISFHHPCLIERRFDDCFSGIVWN